PDRHIEDAAQLVEPAGADAVRAALVFLHLLEGEADRLAELLLAHAETGAAQPHAPADMHVDGMRMIGAMAARVPAWAIEAHQRMIACSRLPLLHAMVCDVVPVTKEVFATPSRFPLSGSWLARGHRPGVEVSAAGRAACGGRAAAWPVSAGSA